MTDNLSHLILKNQSDIFDAISKINNSIEDCKFNQGVVLSSLNRSNSSKNIISHEFKVFSQWGEDGIIQYLVNSIHIENRTFIEFGIEDFSESNCKFLLMKDNWSGFVIDGSEENIGRLKRTNLYWKHELGAVAAFITMENINSLLALSGFEKNVGILSVDIDGNDYHILEAITCISPSIIITEFNAVFGPTRLISVPYRPDFQRIKAHYSNLYFGASLSALTALAAGRGYSLVGVNSAGNNAFYVRNDLLNSNVSAVGVEEVFAPSKFRESRGEDRNLTWLSGESRAAILRGMPVYNVESKLIEPF